MDGPSDQGSPSIQGAAQLTHLVLDVRATPGPGVVLGADHPSVDGAMRLHVELDPGQPGVVADAQLEVGFVHRGVEKLFESRDYRQVIALSDRHDWLGAFCSELGIAIAVEQMAGIRVPPRAGLIRVLLAEVTRISHHLAFLGPLPGDLPDEWRTTAYDLRAEVTDVLEAVTGARIHPTFTVVGGVRADLADDITESILDHVELWRQRTGALLGAELTQLLAGGYRDVAGLTGPDALSAGASGPVARASGIDLDLRRDTNHLPYPTDLLRVPLRQEGDAQARVACLAEEIPVSLDLVSWAARELLSTPAAPVNVKLPKVVRAPEGSTYVMTENPSGINGYYLVSRNEKTPWRLKLRTAGFNNAAALEVALAGTPLAKLPEAVASFFLVPGDVDK